MKEGAREQAPPRRDGRGRAEAGGARVHHPRIMATPLPEGKPARERPPPLILDLASTAWSDPAAKKPGGEQVVARSGMAGRIPAEGHGAEPAGPRATRRAILGAGLTASLTATLGAVLAVSPAAFAGPAFAAEDDSKLTVVKLGAPHSLMDAPVFIAAAKGYLRDEGLRLQTSKFATLSVMTALLVNGQLDVGLGSASAGIVNAVAQGINVRVVAGKGATPPGYGYPFVVASKWTPEQLRNPQAFKGARIGTTTPGGTIEVMWAKLLQDSGLGWNDIQKITLGMPDQAALFSKGEIDASVLLEPFASRVVAEKDGWVWKYSDEVIPDLQAGVVAYGGPFIEKRRDVGQAFMRAYRRGCADFAAAVTKDGWSGAKAEEIIPIVAAYTSVPPEIVRKIKPQYIDPAGGLNVHTIDTSIALWRWIGRVKDKNITAGDIVDLSFLKAA